MSEYRQYLKYLQDNGLMEQYNYLKESENKMQQDESNYSSADNG